MKIKHTPHSRIAQVAEFLRDGPASTPLVAQAFGVTVPVAGSALRRAMNRGLVTASVRGATRPLSRGHRTGPTPTLWSIAR